MHGGIEERLRNLESHITHLEYQLEQLNEVVAAQSRLVERLKKELQRQSSALEAATLERIKSNIQKPPHYQ